MSLPPRVVLVHRRSEYHELITTHGTPGQAAFFLSTRGQSPEPMLERHHHLLAAHTLARQAIPSGWRRAEVERADLSRFLLSAGDVVVVVGQDGLVANVAKYTSGQPVIGINPDPTAIPGTLVRHPVSALGQLLRAAVDADPASDRELTMVTARTDDGRELTALNEIFVGHRSHQSARYVITAGGGSEHQSSSGVIISTGTGASGWCASLSLQTHSRMELPSPDEERLAWFVREAWPSPVTGSSLTQGELTADDLVLRAEGPLVCFGDGMEADRLELSWGEEVRVRVAERRLRLL